LAEIIIDDGSLLTFFLIFDDLVVEEFPSRKVYAILVNRKRDGNVNWFLRLRLWHLLFKTLHCLHIALILCDQFVEFRLRIASIGWIVILLNFSHVCSSCICMTINYFLLQFLVLLLD